MNRADDKVHAISVAQLCDYFLGHATPDDTRDIEVHLATCVACREILTVISLMSGAPADEVAPSEGGHPSLEELVTYYRDPDSLTRDLRARIESHLQSCADCRSELAFLQDVEGDLKRALETTS